MDGTVRGPQRLIHLLRAGEWWEYKLVPIFAVFYATATLVRVPVASLWMAALTVLAALVPGAAYVSIINDITDRADDLAAGKTNHMAGRSRAFMAAAVAIPVTLGLLLCYLWRHDTLLLTVYLCAWLAFSLYSLPPFRFKIRGILGVLCDASGAHLFPTLVAVILAFRGAGRAVDTIWLIAVAAWALSYGVRGILWHQLTDREHDVEARVRTFAGRHPPHVAARLGTYAAFPLECAALAVMLWRLRDAWPVVALLLYALFTARRLRRWEMNAIVVEPRPRYLIVLAEYYHVFLPLSLLLGSASRAPIDLATLALHVLLFPWRIIEAVKDARKLFLQTFVYPVIERRRHRETTRDDTA